MKGLFSIIDKFYDIISYFCFYDKPDNEIL